LISDASGALYSTTEAGGAFGVGTVFQLTPPAVAGGGWTETVLHSFNGSDGEYPYAGLISDASGTFYSDTNWGGTYGKGTVFKLTPPTVAGGGWTETVVHSFAGSDGFEPVGSLISDASGALYGVTNRGGISDLGTVFKLTPPSVAGGSWTEQVLYTFTGGTDGAVPQAGVIFDASGALYGTTYVGGANGSGTVFKLTPPAVGGGAWIETILYSFSGSDGATPFTTLIFDASGALYGTTLGGGAFGVGTVFQLTPPSVAGGAWTETILHSFAGSDGARPYAGLISDPYGALYGTTSAGGTNGAGTVFKLTLPVTFIGVIGQPNCVGQSYTTLAKQYGGIGAAARKLGYSSVQALQDALTSYCGS
jgi:uncharacterized repeat protein (TIGR03803 family)